MLISMVNLREFPVPQGSVQSFFWKVESNFVRNKVFVWVPPCAEYTNVIIISFQSLPPSDRVVDDICHPLTFKLPLTSSNSRFSVCLVNYSACLMDPTESIGSSTSLDILFLKFGCSYKASVAIAGDGRFPHIDSLHYIRIMVFFQGSPQKCGAMLFNGF